MTAELEAKICSKCKIQKPRSEYNRDSSKSDGLYSSCKACYKLYKKSHYIANREAIISKVFKWEIENKDRVRANKRKYSRSSKGILRMQEYRRNNRHKYYPKTVEQKLKASWRKKMCKIKRLTRFNFKTFIFLGYTADQLKSRIEYNFKSGMSWDNYGVIWHIDHKKPLSLFDYTNQQNIKNSWMLCNLQPLFVKDNLRKGNRWLNPMSCSGSVSTCQG